MKTRLIIATFVAGLSVTALAVSPLSAQTPPSGTRVYLVDISAVFKEHPRFNREMDAIKAEIERYDADARVQRDTLTKEADEMNRNLNAGSLDYKNKEAELANRSANLQVQAALKRKEIMEHEAKLYYDVYNEVVAAVAELSQRHGIGLVLRFNSTKIDPKDRASVMQGVNRSIVFHQQLDITGAVTEMIRRPAQPGVANRPGNQPVNPQR